MASKNDKEMYWTHIEGKSVVSERFIRALKNKIYKYITSISVNVYIDKLSDIVKKYNNTYHKTIKIKPVDVKSKNILTLAKKIVTEILNLRLVVCETIKI